MTIGSSDGKVYENAFHHALGIENPVTPTDLPGEDNNAPRSSTARPGGLLEGDREVYVIRHGDTDFNQGEGEEEKIRGWSPVPLNQEGIDDAHKTAEDLKDKGLTSLVSSDLPRAKQTANIIGKKLGITPTFDPALRTWDMGELTGKPISDHEVKCAEHVTSKPDEPIPGGESFNEFKARALGGVSSAIQSDPDGKVGIVTHNSTERVLDAWQKAGEPADGSIHNETYLAKGEQPGGHETYDVGPSIHDIESMTHGEEKPNTAEPILNFLREYRKGGMLHAIIGDSEPEWSKKLFNISQGLGDAASVSSPFMGAMRLMPRSPNEPGVFHIINSEDKTVGHLDTTYDPSNKKIHVGMVSTSLASPKTGVARQANYHSHALGLAEVRNLMYALKEEYPDAKWVEGWRVSGSRSDVGRLARGEESRGKSSDQLVKMPTNRRPQAGEPLDPEFEKELADIVKTVKPTRPEAPSWTTAGTSTPGGMRIRSPIEELQSSRRSLSDMTEQEWNNFEQEFSRQLESTRPTRR